MAGKVDKAKGRAKEAIGRAVGNSTWNAKASGTRWWAR